jgi:curved DNA-binding protein CbpA
MASDPIEVLGISRDATDEEIRAAYLQKVREHPPDRSPEQFEQIRDAYEVLRDAERRSRREILGALLDLRDGLWRGLESVRAVESAIRKSARHKRSRR